MLWLNYFCILSLFIAVFAKYVPPVIFWIPAFFGLAFPFIFILNILFILYWFVQFKHAFIFGCIALAFALPTTFRYFNFSSSESNNNPYVIKVVSYNSMLFDLYNWRHDKVTRPKIFGTIAENTPNILCLQEFYTSENPKDHNNIKVVKKVFDLPNEHVEYSYTQFDIDHWGVATFSKFPILNKGKILFNTTSNNICIFTDLLINNDTIRVYNLHLQSIAFSDADNKFLEEVISENKDAEEELAHSKHIVKRLKRAFTKRTKQVEKVRAHMKKCRYKIILCGDFNDTVASYAYEALSEELKDAFLEKGNGIGRTYAGKWPQFRIDYILHSEKLKCLKYARSTETFTDHYPISAIFEQ
jgi:endonuclease/exonuclease/phosphatase family metal-dependent hydrolase